MLARINILTYGEHSNISNTNNMMKRFITLTSFLCSLLLMTTASLAQNKSGFILQKIQPQSIGMTGRQVGDYDFANYSSQTDSFDLYLDNDFSFLGEQSSDKGFILQHRNKSSLGNELIVGKKLSKILSVHVNLFENDSVNSFLAPSFLGNSYTSESADMLGYQLGISSVLNLTGETRFGIELEHGKVEADFLSSLGENMTATSFGLGIRTGRFGASFNSELFTPDSAGLAERTTMDFQFDWHFTEKGTISFGAHKNMSDGESSQIKSIDDLTGTIPYIKFRHNL